jgi:hypothetical protein
MIPEDVVAAAGPNDPERLLPVRSVAGPKTDVAEPICDVCFSL